MVELACHGCGHGTLIIFPYPMTVTNTNDGNTVLRGERDAFENRHTKCPNRGYEATCEPVQQWREVKNLLSVAA